MSEVNSLNINSLNVKLLNPSTTSKRDTTSKTTNIQLSQCGMVMAGVEITVQRALGYRKWAIGDGSKK